MGPKDKNFVQSLPNQNKRRPLNNEYSATVRRAETSDISRACHVALSPTVLFNNPPSRKTTYY
jgi:hypothetical protein